VHLLPRSAQRRSRYEITKALNETTDDLAAVHAEGKAWSLEQTKPFYEGKSVPFHPGAERYYKEVWGE
jgi:TRAP-type uncharacterized transport system substrate-binding protein